MARQPHIQTMEALKKLLKTESELKPQHLWILRPMKADFNALKYKLYTSSFHFECCALTRALEGGGLGSPAPIILW